MISLNTLYNKVAAFLIVSGLFMFLLMGCSEKDPEPGDPGPVVPAVTTSAVLITGYTSATSGGTVISEGGSPVTARGVCWDTLPNAKTSGLHTTDGGGMGTFTSQLTGLKAYVKYYVRAYASNSYGTSYGAEDWFRIVQIVLDTVSDADGNTYHVIEIAGKSWMQENLRTTRYRNGDEIAKVIPDNSWKILTTGAYCIFEDYAPNILLYGNLYNWHALSDSRGICPDGWHVPDVSEWSALGNSLGGNAVAGGKLKSTGTIEGSTGLWYAPNTDATNSSGFSGVPGGYRINYGTYYSLGNVGYFWSSSDTASVNAWNYILDANNGELKRNFNLKTNGFSVRCCKD